jgi:hypothetical protein
LCRLPVRFDILWGLKPHGTILNNKRNKKMCEKCTTVAGSSRLPAFWPKKTKRS